MKKQLLILVLASIFCIQMGYSQTTYTVTSTSKDGPGSINEAIDLANINPGPDIIEFTPGLQINATHLGYIPGGLGDYMLNITESVTIDGKGGALIGSQRWINASGDWNSINDCPGKVPSGSTLASMPNFMQVGIINVDNTGITVTVKNLSIEQFNSIAEVRDNAVLEFENFNADKIWSTLSCNPRSLLNAGTGSSISIKNSQFTNTKNWGTLGSASEINSLNAGDLTVENTLFFNNNGGDSYAISWDGQANSKVNIVSSRFMSSGGIQVSGNVSVSNIVNSIWVNQDNQNPKFGDRIINDASGDMNITASSLMWNNNNCDFSCQTEQNSSPLIVRKGAGKINFIQSAIGINFPSGSATLVNTLGNTGTGDGFTADDNTYIQSTTNQNTAALIAITSQPSLYTTGTAFTGEVIASTYYFDVEMVTPAFPGELIDQILSNKVLLHPITNATITKDVLGNDRVDANGDRNIGAIQVSLAPFLSLVGIGDGIVNLGWTEPLHHNGLPILRYEIEYYDGGFAPISIIIDPPVLSKTISSLANGTEHKFYVRAIYDNGNVEAEGPLSNEIAAKPYGSMVAPTLTATPGSTEVALSWNVSDLGGRTFQQYTILWYEQVSGDFVGAHTTTDRNETTYIVSGLTNGTIYDFKITTRASEDTSPAGTASATPLSLVIPTPIVVTTSGDKQVRVSWNPIDLGGRTFNSYTLQWKVSGSSNFIGDKVISDINTTTTVITGLTNKNTYEFNVAVTATNGDRSDYGVSIATLVLFYPNPVNDVFYINLLDENIDVKLFSMNGALLKEVKNKKTIDISNFSSGTYILQIQIKDKIYSNKILKN